MNRARMPSEELKDAISQDDHGRISDLLKKEEAIEAFSFALDGRHFAAAEFLLSLGADANHIFSTTILIDRDNYDETTSYLRQAVAKGNTESVEFLLKHGADPNFKGIFAGTTALMDAIKYGHLEMVGLVLDHGADVNAQDSYDALSPLDAAAQFGYTEVLELLLAHKAEPSFRAVTFSSAKGETSLEISRMLLDAGADVNERGVWGRTPLMWAADRAPIETVRFLIDRGAEIDAVAGPFGASSAGSNETALQLAKRKNRREIVSLLEELGARSVRTTYD
jgi:ankyrin repeat protein